MELTRPKAILFDWDNTLVNTWPVIHEALHNTFTQLGREPWSIETVKQRVSRSMRDSFPELFGDTWEEAASIYQKHYRDIHLAKLEALADAEALLSYLKKQPVYVAVVSNKKGSNLRLEAEHLGWTHYFSKLIGANDTPRDKPSPEPVIAALEGSGIAPGKDVWFVGDSTVDMEVAHATGCVPIWYGELPSELMKHPFHSRAGNHLEMVKFAQGVF
jgi:phosphoglycolate phosphatase